MPDFDERPVSTSGFDAQALTDLFFQLAKNDQSVIAFTHESEVNYIIEGGNGPDDALAETIDNIFIRKVAEARAEIAALPGVLQVLSADEAKTLDKMNDALSPLTGQGVPLDDLRDPALGVASFYSKRAANGDGVQRRTKYRSDKSDNGRAPGGLSALLAAMGRG